MSEETKGFNYLRETRSFGLSVVSILPLIVLYHCGIVQSGYPVRNLAQVWLEGPLQLVGLHAAHLLNVALIVALVAVLSRSDSEGGTGLLMVVVMIAEGLLYGYALYTGGEVLTRAVFERASGVLFAVSFRDYAPLLLALGAGVYEELFFRLLLLGGGSLLMSRLFGWDKRLSLALGLVVSSALFAGAHHIGPLGEEFNSYVFLFRALSGALLGVIYIFRGFGIAVWTHSIYNLLAVL